MSGVTYSETFVGTDISGGVTVATIPPGAYGLTPVLFVAHEIQVPGLTGSTQTYQFQTPGGASLALDSSGLLAAAGQGGDGVSDPGNVHYYNLVVRYKSASINPGELDAGGLIKVSSSDPSDHAVIIAGVVSVDVPRTGNLWQAIGGPVAQGTFTTHSFSGLFSAFAQSSLAADPSPWGLAMAAGKSSVAGPFSPDLVNGQNDYSVVATAQSGSFYVCVAQWFPTGNPVNYTYSFSNIPSTLAGLVFPMATLRISAPVTTRRGRSTAQIIG